MPYLVFSEPYSNMAEKCLNRIKAFNFHSHVDALYFDTFHWATLSTDLNHDTYEQTGNSEQNNVLCEPWSPKGTVLNANGTQHFLEPEFLLQHQAFDGHAHCVHEGQHQEHGDDASNTLNEAGCWGKQSKMSELHIGKGNLLCLDVVFKIV